MKKEHRKMLGQANLVAVAAALTVTGVAGGVSADEITPQEEVILTVTSDSSGVTVNGPIPSYDREDAREEQSFVDELTDKDEFLDSIVANNEAITPDSVEDLAKLLDDKIKNHEGAIVITENASYGDMGQGTNLVNGSLLEEVKKQGLSSAALVSGYSVNLQDIGDGTLTWVLTPYYEETKALADAREQYIQEVSTFVNSNHTSDIEKLNAIYSYLAQTTVYSTEGALPTGSPSSLILNNEAVCEAFAYVYNEIGNKVGLNMKYVTGVATQNGDSIGHAWNLVELDGQWFNTDATWGNIDRDKENGIEVNMSYFLFSDTVASNSRVREYDTSEALPAATDTTYDVLYNEHGTGFGGGVTGNLIVSPNDDEIVIFDNVEKTSGYSFPRATENYQILKTALIDDVLYVSYFDNTVQKYKVGYMNITSIQDGNVEINELSEATNVVKNFGLDGIVMPGGSVISYVNGEKIIANQVNFELTVDDNNDFPLNGKYKDFVIANDTVVLEDLHALYDGYIFPGGQLVTDLTIEQIEEVSRTLALLKDNTVSSTQQALFKDYQTLVSVGKKLPTFTDSTDSVTENTILLEINKIADITVKQKATDLFNSHKDALISEETPEIPPVTPEEPETPPVEPEIPPVTPEEPETPPVEPEIPPVTPEEPETPPVEPENPPVTPEEPETPPVEPEIPPVTPEEPETPPVEPEIPPVTPEEPETPPVEPEIPPVTPEEPGTPPVKPETPPVTPVVPETPSVTPVAPETPSVTPVVPETPSVTPIVPETPVTSTENVITNLDINIISGTTAVEIDVTNNGTIIIKSDELSNRVGVTITLPVEKVHGILKIKTDKGYETVPYTVKNGQIIAQLHKAGELVFVDAIVELEDISKNQYKEYIVKLAERGIISGDNGKFNANEKATRGQFAAMIARALGLNDINESVFNDLTSNQYAGSINALAELGIVNGNVDGSFNANGSITRQQAFTMIGRLLEQKGYTIDTNASSLAGFNDANSVSDYAKPYVDLLISIGAVDGDNGNLNPQKEITRGQITKILATVLTELEML